MEGNFLLSNKSYIENKIEETNDEKEKKELKYLYLLTGGKIKYSKLKQSLGLFLTKSFDTLSDIQAITYTNKIHIKEINFEKNSLINKSYKEILYKNKVKTFNNNINLFQQKLKFLKERKDEHKKLFDFIATFRELGFFLDENYNINYNDILLDLNNILIHHKWIHNLKELINIDNKYFIAVKNYSGGDLHYQLKSDFFEEFTKKYDLLFELKLELRNNLYIIVIKNDIFEMNIAEELKVFKIGDRNTCKLLIFYTKYLLYKLLKEEIKEVKRLFNPESKETTFQLNGLIFLLEKFPNLLAVKCSYMDNLIVHFIIKKVKKNIGNTNNIFSYMTKPVSNNQSNNPIILKNLQMMNVYHSTKLILSFFNNLFYSIHLHQKITNFISDVKRIKNLVLEDLIKNTIIINNLKNISVIFLRDMTSDIIREITRKAADYKITISNNIYPYSHSLGSFLLFIEVKKAENSYKIFYFIELCFDNELNLTIKIKEPYRNSILTLDKSQNISIEKGRINFQYLFEIIKQYLI